MSFSFIKACSLTTDSDIHSKLSSFPQNEAEGAATENVRWRCDVWLEGVFQSQRKPSENRWIFNENKTSKRNKIQFSDNL